MDTGKAISLFPLVWVSPPRIPSANLVPHKAWEKHPVNGHEYVCGVYKILTRNFICLLKLAFIPW
jgi:hypothetical protein